MKLKILFSSLLISLVSTSYAQFENATNDSKFIDTDQKIEFEGSFTYVVNNLNYLIELSVSNGSYVEKSESGSILSIGSFERTGDISYSLIPNEVFEGAIIDREIVFKTVSLTDKYANIEVYDIPNEFQTSLIISKI